MLKNSVNVIACRWQRLDIVRLQPLDNGLIMIFIRFLAAFGKILVDFLNVLIYDSLSVFPTKIFIFLFGQVYGVVRASRAYIM